MTLNHGRKPHCTYYLNTADGSVGTATGYELKNRDSIPDSGKRFSLLHSVQTGSGAHTASYYMDNGSSFPGAKAAGA
jgi:hypothetical protein